MSREPRISPIPTWDRVPLIHVTIIEKNRSDAEAFFRGFFLDQKLNAIEFQGEDAQPYSMLRGAVARVDEYFGDILRVLHGDREWYKFYFNVYGLMRISRPRSNPQLTVVEGSDNRSWPLIPKDASLFLGCRVHYVYSQIGYDISNLDPRAQGPYIPEAETRECFAHIWATYDNGCLVRRVAAYYELKKYRFNEEGVPLYFEDPEKYNMRLVRDRLNRQLICEYLDALGIDPEGTFERRELVDPVLFTVDKAGELLDSYVEDLKRYRTTDFAGSKVGHLAPSERAPHS